jgi:hypothetical protein
LFFSFTPPKKAALSRKNKEHLEDKHTRAHTRTHKDILFDADSFCVSHLLCLTHTHIHTHTVTRVRVLPSASFRRRRFS